MKRITIELAESEMKMLLWALSETDSAWSHICTTSNDEDQVADYGNDLIQLRAVRARLTAEATAVFGAHVREFGRETL